MPSLLLSFHYRVPDARRALYLSLSLWFLSAPSCGLSHQILGKLIQPCCELCFCSWSKAAMLSPMEASRDQANPAKACLHELHQLWKANGRPCRRRREPTWSRTLFNMF